MRVIGGIQAYQEEGNIGGAVRSLYAAGCDHVVMLDGAWILPDGSVFGGGSLLSSDETVIEAADAGAEIIYPIEPLYGDAGKRDWLIRNVGAERDDRVLLMDADERMSGEIDRDQIPAGHAVVILRNLRENDLPGIRGTFPSGDYGPKVPLIRWLRWSKTLRCDAPGRYRDHKGAIEPYVSDIDPTLDPEFLCALPILPGIEILHGIIPTPERVKAKRAYYEAVLA